MKKIVFPLSLVRLVIMACGCAKMPTRGEYVKLDAAPVITADAESSVIYFLRESAFMGGGISYYIWEDNQQIGLLKSSSYFMHRATPGKHTYWAETEARASITLDVQGGNTYYVEGGVGMGMLAGRPQLTEIPKPVADRLLPELEYIRLATPEEAISTNKKNSMLVTNQRCRHHA